MRYTVDMTLTLANGPLSTSPPTEANYAIDGPAHRLLLTPFPRRVRATLGASDVFDTDRGVLLHESNLLPALYVPVDDIDTDLLVPTDRSTHCPFKGDASYWTVTVGDLVAENAVWAYERPLATAPWLDGLRAFYWDRLDHWYDEDEEVFGHLRDPYHRVDVRRSRRTVTVSIGGVAVAETSSAMVLSETGLPNRWYVPRADVCADLLDVSSTSTHCPYKGWSTYWSFTGGDEVIADVAWSYDEPFDDARRVAEHLGFDGDAVAIDVR